MSADESALLAAVAADPANDLPRLVYADWLDDHGHATRAEFIRLQCQIAKLEVGPRAEVDRNWRLWKRQQDLLDDHLEEVLGPAAFLASPEPVSPSLRPELRRGFAWEVALPVGRFLQIDHALAALPLLPRVTVYDLEVDWSGFFRSPHLDAVAAVEVYNADASMSDPGLGIAQAFRSTAARLPRMDRLDFNSCDVTDVAMHDLADAGFPALRSLDLSNCYLTDEGVITLLNGRFAQRLEQLVLDGNPLGDQAAFELADRLAPVKTFRTLDFRRTNVTSAGQLALTSAFGSRCNLF